MSDAIFKKGEIIIVYDGGRYRTSIELGEIGKDSSYGEDTVLINYGNYNTAVSKASIHKAPASLKRKLKEGKL